tara:strand:+ start:571 stop:1533 length:963 start_codon:yes stop_codon:yes gene_type:complete
MENAPSDNNNINQNQNTGTNIKVDLGGRQKGGFLNEASVSPTGFQQYGNWITNLDYHHHAIWIVMVVLILFTSTFDYLGIAYDEQLNRYGPLTKDISSLEIFLWGLLIFLVLVNGMQYYLGVNIKTAIHQLFSPTPEVDIELGKEADKLIGLKKEQEKVEDPDEVFHVGKNIYSYDEAKAVCKAYNSELASYDQIEDAYNKGAEWCSYGWSKDQLALFPTQKVTWENIQKKNGACGNNGNNCGRPGINGGFIDNPMVKFGVNCYGKKPNATEDDLKKLNEMQAMPKSKEEEELECQAKKMKEKIKDMDLRPFNKQRWKEM